MSIRDEIEKEAHKAAIAIRSALVEYNKATGLSLDVDPQWVTVSRFGEPGSIHVAAVRVLSGGVEAVV